MNNNDIIIIIFIYIAPFTKGWLSPPVEAQRWRMYYYMSGWQGASPGGSGGTVPGRGEARGEARGDAGSETRKDALTR